MNTGGRPRKAVGKVLILAMAIIRKQQGISQEELALRIGCHQPEISWIETGEVYPTKERLELIARELKVDEPEDLLLSYKEYLDRQRQLHSGVRKSPSS